MSVTKLYGVPFSQPVRAVMWLMIMHKAPFELVLTNPGSRGDNGSRHPDYLAKCPGGTIPCLEETDTGFTLGEAHAIMTYLSRTRGWHDVYPDNEQARARIDAYLHYHHRNVREASIGLVAPKIRKDLDIPEVLQASARQNLTAALKTLERSYLGEHKFLMGDTVTLADLAAYVEIGQLRPEFTNVFDMSEFSHVTRWLDDMKSVPGHDVVHTVLAEMGDISQESPTMDAIKAANIAALRSLKSALAEF